jgi:hypothetical protein
MKIINDILAFIGVVTLVVAFRLLIEKPWKKKD